MRPEDETLCLAALFAAWDAEKWAVGAGGFDGVDPVRADCEVMTRLECARREWCEAAGRRGEPVLGQPLTGLVPSPCRRVERELRALYDVVSSLVALPDITRYNMTAVCPARLELCACVQRYARQVEAELKAWRCYVEARA